jgi:hypothetical protein
MKLRIRNHGTTLSLLSDEGDLISDLQGVTIASGDNGVQLLVHLQTDDVEIDGDDTTDISETINALLAQLDKDDD